MGPRGGSRYSDSRYSDISNWAMQGLGLELGLGLGIVLGSGLGLELVLVALFQKHFVGIAACIWVPDKS